MKKRLTRILNFFAFNLLFFALYLNFIHKDSNTPVAIHGKSANTAMQGTTLVKNPEQYLNKSIKAGNSTNQKVSYN
jgi:hypothetical protein